MLNIDIDHYDWLMFKFKIELVSRLNVLILTFFFLIQFVFEIRLFRTSFESTLCVNIFKAWALFVGLSYPFKSFFIFDSSFNSFMLCNPRNIITCNALKYHLIISYKSVYYQAFLSNIFDLLPLC